MLGPVRLSTEEARVLGSLVEKALTTPQQYPLTLTALVAACNQTSNRDPVVTYDEDTVVATLQELKTQKLIRFVLPSHGRSVVRYRQVLDEAWGVDSRQSALLSVLLLRGPQTLGELRSRTDRMTQFDGLDEVDHELEYLASLEQPLTLRLGRRPGQKEERWICPLVDLQGHVAEDAVAGGDFETASEGRAAPDATTSRDALVPRSGTELDFRSQLAILRSEVDKLRQDLDALRVSLGG
jgi:uncharacterized protein YceH (UPF0502 family)